tara:strand:+ start:54 stop:317 length:264 start_codon:yes stop_codon:yes gene_type:complete
MAIRVSLISKTHCFISRQKRQSTAIGLPRRGHCNHNRFAATGDSAVDSPQAASTGPPKHGAVGKEGSIKTMASSTTPKSFAVVVITV